MDDSNYNSPLQNILRSISENDWSGFSSRHQEALIDWLRKEMFEIYGAQDKEPDQIISEKDLLDFLEMKVV